MPYGISWPRFSMFVVAAMGSIFAGSQVVHVIYRPLDDLEKYIEEIEKAEH